MKEHKRKDTNVMLKEDMAAPGPVSGKNCCAEPLLSD